MVVWWAAAWLFCRAEAWHTCGVVTWQASRQPPGRPAGWQPVIWPAAAWLFCRAEAWCTREAADPWAHGVEVWQGGKQWPGCSVCQRTAVWLLCEVEAQWACRLLTVALCGWQPTCSFSVLWHGEEFHRLGVQGAEISALPGALPQPSLSPVSQQGPWFTELMQSASVSQLPFWILSQSGSSDSCLSPPRRVLMGTCHLPWSVHGAIGLGFINHDQLMCLQLWSPRSGISKTWTTYINFLIVSNYLLALSP
jgi:hypothetical protein